MCKSVSLVRNLWLPVLLSVAAIDSQAHFPDLEGSSRPSLAPVLENVKDAVVNISVIAEQEYRIPWFDSWQPRVPRRSYTREIQSAGSGVVIDADKGLVVTNHHVIVQAKQVIITLQDQRSFNATFLGSDPATDIALLKIEANNLVDLELTDSDLLNVGDYVIAIGNPFGLGQTVTSGIVSALGRNQLSITDAEDFIQTDASINPGNSGGALIDIEGQLVGINTAIYSPSGASSGIGFAIPTNMVRSITDQLIEYGNVKRGSFGISIDSLNAEVAKAAGLSTNTGVVVTEVFPGSGADQAGMRIDDVIVKFDGKVIANSVDLATRIKLLRIGEDFDLSVIRNGREIEVEGKVQEFKRGQELIPGVYVDEISSSHPHFGRIRGIMISDIDTTTFGENKFQVGDILFQVNQRSISKLEDVETINLVNRPLIFGLVRGTQQFRIILR